MKAALLFGTLALAACSKDNPYYCEGSPDHNCGDQMTEMPDAAPAGCQSSTECAGSTPVCEEHVCRGCEAHGECASTACLPNGTCGSGDSVGYAAQAGSEADRK